MSDESSYGGLIAVVRNAEEQGVPIHCATRTTCAEHLANGDDKRDNFAFGQAGSDSRAVELLRELLDMPSDLFEQDQVSNERLRNRVRSFLKESGAVPASGEGAE